MPQTVRSLITGALRLLGAISAGETATADEAMDGLSSLNSLVSSLAAGESLIVYHTPRLLVPLVLSKPSYTMGERLTPQGAPVADIVTPRPFRLEMAQVTLVASPVIELPVAIWDQPTYERETLKSTMSSWPQAVYLESSWPEALLWVWPVPTQPSTLTLFPWLPLAEFPSLETLVDLPPGYERFLRTRLALEIAPEYGREPSMLVVQMAQEAYAAVCRQNQRTPMLAVDAGLLPHTGGGDRWAIYRGE